ncbi:MAG TPA: PLDc N-terminal domain-containing protein, partial [Candidatus Agrococcus pullicola]|nr:PLDc N-terminal domain-containing protein [Candidatus Agrococcus pullicola]
MTLGNLAMALYIAFDLVIKIVAIGVVPENRKPSSSTAWLLLILFIPVVGVPLFLLIGSPYINKRRQNIQAQAN